MQIPIKVEPVRARGYSGHHTPMVVLQNDGVHIFAAFNRARITMGSSFWENRVQMISFNLYSRGKSVDHEDWFYSGNDSVSLRHLGHAPRYLSFRDVAWIQLQRTGPKLGVPSLRNDWCMLFYLAPKSTYFVFDHGDRIALYVSHF